MKFITEEPIINALVTVDPIPHMFSHINLENIPLESHLDDEVDIRGSFIEELLEQVDLVIKEKAYSKFEELVVEAQLQSNTSSLETDVGQLIGPIHYGVGLSKHRRTMKRKSVVEDSELNPFQKKMMVLYEEGGVTSVVAMSGVFKGERLMENLGRK